MRLTLRTMLAYLDGVLDAQDAATLGKKIEESKFASDLVARIKAVSRNPRLAVPRLEGKGMGLDPNTVAEYLGSLLPADRVPDFEKVCLESDVHLAEVAACHHILTMVLGQPADIKPSSRERMYRVGARVADAHAKQKSAASESKGKPKVDPGVDKAAPAAKASPAAHAAAPVSRDGHAPANERSPREQPVAKEKATREEKPSRNDKESRGDRPVREKPEVPDYLREARRRRVWPLLLTVLFAFLLAGVLLRALGPFDRSHPLARLVLGSPTELAANNGTNPAPEVPGEKLPGEKTPGETPDPGKTPVEPAEVKQPSGPGENEPSTTPEDDSVRPVKPVEPPPDPEPAVGVPTKPAVEPKVPVEPEPAEPKPREPTPAKPKPVPPPGARPESAMVVGRFISDQQQILARYDSKTEEWLRIAKDTSLNAGDRLLVLPTYRPQLVLSDPGVQITVATESLLELLPPDEKGVSFLKIEYGRLTIATIGKPGALIGLDLGNRQGIASFDNVDSVLAVEVRRFRYPGDFPEESPSSLVSEVFPAAGSISWAEAGGETVKLGSKQVRVFEDDKPGVLEELEDLPDWVSGKGQNPVDRMASQWLADKLPVDRSLLLSLEERAEFTKESRTEVRSLAIRSLMYLNVFEPFVIALSDDKFKSYWSSQFDTAQESLARSPEAAAELRKALAAVRTEDAATLYRVLVGYSPEELGRSGADKLIEYLGHELLDFRVLALETLLRITGKTLSYRPENPLPRRSQPVQRWRQEKAAGTLVYKTVPSPLVERKGIARTPAPAKEPTPAKVPPPPEPPPP